MLYKIAINNTLHIPFLRKYFGFLFFNALPLPPRFFRGGGKTSSGGGKVSGGALPHLPPPRLSATGCLLTYRVFRKNCIFYKIHCNPSLAYTFNFQALNLMRVYSLCTTISSRVPASEGWQTFGNSWKKNTIFNEHPVFEYNIIM